MNEEKQVLTLIASSFIVLIVLAGFLIWRSSGHAAPPHGSQCSCPFCTAASAGPSQKQTTFSAALPSVGNRAASKSSYLSDLPSRNGQRSAKPATGPNAADKVVATVNGEPIFEAELMANLPDDAFQSRLDNLKESKLKRLVEEALEWQFLEDRKVTLSPEQFAKAAADFETMVKTPGCPCCGGGFASVEQFVQVKAFSPQEFHRRITCDGGLKLYAARLEQQQTSPQALAETVQKRRAEIERDRMMAYAISFDYTRDGVYLRDDATLHATKQKLANDAFTRLKKGESFENVAKRMSEDGLSDPKGGALQCVRADLLDPEVQKVLDALEPGKFSPVIETAWGCSIVKRKKLTDEDIRAVVKEQAKTSAEDQMYDELDAWRKRAKIQYGAAYVPPPASINFGAK